MSDNTSDQHHVSIALVLALGVFIGYVYLGNDTCERARRAASPAAAFAWMVEKTENLIAKNEDRPFTADWKAYHIDIAGFFYKAMQGKSDQCQWLNEQKRALYDSKSKTEEDAILEDLERRIVGPRP